MVWAIAALAVIAVGLPFTAWVTTRGLARRPPQPLTPYHSRTEKWIHRHYELGWEDCAQVRKAVDGGRRVADPALESAARQLATATMARKVPAVRMLYLTSIWNLALGPLLTAFGIYALFWAPGSPFSSTCFIVEGSCLFVLAWAQIRRGLVRVRRNAARALQLNDPQPGSQSEPPPAIGRPADA